MSWGSILSVVGQIGGSALSAAQTWKTSKSNYKSLRQEADTIRSEASSEAETIREEADKFAKQQMMGFVSSGVTGEGTPTVLTKETYELGEEEATNVLEAAEAQATALDRQAKAQKQAGKAAIISAIFGSASSGS